MRPCNTTGATEGEHFRLQHLLPGVQGCEPVRVGHAQGSCDKGFLKNLQNFYNIHYHGKKSQSGINQSDRHYLSINYIFFLITEQLLRFKYLSIWNILGVFPSGCSCKDVQGTA